MHLEEIDYRHNSKTFGGYLAYDETQTGPKPGILVIHDVWGLGEQPRERARRLAELGYVALAVDLFGDRQQPKEISEGLALVGDLLADTRQFRELLRAGVDTLARHSSVDSSRLAAIGFCLGGSSVLELAREGVDLRGVVCFHGNLDTQAPARKGQVKAKVLVCTGGDDELIPNEQRASFEHEMKEAGIDWQLNIYGGAEHSFTNAFVDRAGISGVRYDEKADVRSWEAMRQFLSEVLSD
jgi:dienelactone hydrolase